MNPSLSSPITPFGELLQRVLNGEASRKDVACLNHSLPKNAAARRYYMEMLSLHGALEDEIQPAARVIPFPGRKGSRSTMKPLAVAAAVALPATAGALPVFR